MASSEEVLQLVAELDSLDDIVWSEPEFLSNYSVTNPLYPQQYYLRNTGQNGGTPGIDINVEPAWNITNGNTNIVVAVVDVGVDRNHEDMGNRVLEGHTIRNPTGGGLPQNINSLDLKYHGIACAGIIAASNNTIGIRGVANNVSILPVNIVPDEAHVDSLGRIIYGFGTNIEIAQAISWTWRRADVLSCSWGGGAPSNDITATIDSARTFGRNGRGSVVVFSSGNNWPNTADVAYPGDLDGVITVGAITNQGIICNYSQRGPSMDLVAPTGNASSVSNVTTTDRMGSLGKNSGNYMYDFGGTSAACPQVAGVVALMLSIRPDLTEDQIRTILQNTARDLGPAGFDVTYGFGLVNAHSALQAVYISGPSLVCSSGSSFTINSVPSGSTIQWSCGPYLSRVSSQGSNPCTFSSTGSGSSWISATIYTGGDTITLPHYDVWSGLPLVWQVTGPSNGCIGNQYTFYADYPPQYLAPTTFEWSISPEYEGNVIYGYDWWANAHFNWPSEELYQIRCTPQNACGTGNMVNTYIYIYDCGYEYSLYPNPASTEVTVTVTRTDNSLNNMAVGNTIFDISIFDNYGVKYFQGKYSGDRFTIPVYNLKNGNYFVKIDDGKNVAYKQLIIMH